MSIKLTSFLVGAVLGMTATSAFAFDAMVSAPTPLRTGASPRAAVIEVIPPKSVVDMARCKRGWCEVVFEGRLGYVYTPLLVSGEPVGEPDIFDPLQIIAAPVAAVGAVAAPVAQ